MNVEKISHGRIEWIDMAKGYGIILVIFAHLGVPLWGTWIYSFHMPLFFFLSGYVFSEKCDFITFLKKKMKALLIPYFCLGIPILVFQLRGTKHERIRISLRSELYSGEEEKN